MRIEALSGWTSEQRHVVAACFLGWTLDDLRDMPPDVQEIAFAQGLIPYIPADRKDRS